MINFNKIETNILIGSAPQTASDVERLSELNVTAVLSLQSDEDLLIHKIDWSRLKIEYAHKGVHVQRYQINDFDEFDMGKRLVLPVVQLKDFIESGHCVYVHCNAGVCRAPGTVLAYYCCYKGMSIEQGLRHIRQSRPQANPYISAVQKTLDHLII